jgi:Peptidase family M50.
MLRFKLGRMKIGISIWFASFFAIILFVSDNSVLLYCLLAMICHELGHFIVMLAAGCSVRGFYLLFGRLVIVPTRPISHSRHEILVLGGGIAANILCLLVFTFAGNVQAALINLAIAAYNALPAGELDGGAILLGILSRRYLPKNAHTIHLVISFIVSLLLLTAGFLMLIRGYKNVTAIFSGIYIMAQSIKNMTWKRRIQA